MEVVIDAPATLAALAADAVEALVRRRPDAVLGLATGSSPLAVYDELARRHAEHGLSFAGVPGFLLDEYVGLPAGHPERVPHGDRAGVRRRVDMPTERRARARTVGAEDLAAACAGYEAAIAGGRRGRPADPRHRHRRSRRVQRAGLLAGLADPDQDAHRADPRDNARFFDGDVDAVPRHVLTQGLGTIMAARHLVLLATGAARPRPCTSWSRARSSAMWPATVLQLHPHVTVLVDEGAASRLQLAAYYRETWESKPAWQASLAAPSARPARGRCTSSRVVCLRVRRSPGCAPLGGRVGLWNVSGPQARRPAAVPMSERGHRRRMTSTRPPTPRVITAAPERAAVLRRSTASGSLLRIRRGAYVDAATVGEGWQAAERLARARAVAVVRATTAQVWLSHETAALLWGLPLLRVPGVTHVVQRHHPGSRRDRAVARHRVDLPPPHRAEIEGLPVTSLERTALDCACSLPGPAALAVLDGAVRRGTDATAVAALLVERAGGRGVVVARRAVTWADARAESPGESAARWVCLAGGLPAPDLQHAIRTRLGTFYADLAWPELRVVVEFDGVVKYTGTYGPGGEALVAEKRRQDAIEEAGWRVIRVTWADLKDPDDLAVRVARAARRVSRSPS